MFPWIKIYAQNVLTGTMAGEPLEYQAIWLRLLCLANTVSFRDGSLRFPPDEPMSREYIAIAAKIPVDKLKVAVEYFKHEVNEDINNPHYGQPRLQERDNGMLFITNFAESQAVPDGRRALMPETPREREYREKRRLRQDVRKYPRDAKEAMTEARNKTQLESQSKAALEHIKGMPVGSKE